MSGKVFLRLHRDESGTISIVSVFGIILLAMLLGMVMNAGLHVDDKVRMQDAADASAYSGGLVLARSMNTLAFTNHLLCDVFALTAFMREARDRNAESQVPPILAAWDRIAPQFSSSGFAKFQALGPAISAKVPKEQEMVRTYSQWAAASSEQMLPVLEEILKQRMIPQFQRSLVATTPQLAQLASDEIARRHGQTSETVVRPYSTSPSAGTGAAPAASPVSPGMTSQGGAAAQPGMTSQTPTSPPPAPAPTNSGSRGPIRGVLWRTLVDPVGGSSEQGRRTLPVVDPVNDSVAGQETYRRTAIRQRKNLSHQYLRDWNDVSMRAFDIEAKMSQFGALWRGFTCGQLEKLLDEYPNDNLPHVIRTESSSMTNPNAYLEQDFMFVGVVYRRPLVEWLPGLFHNPLDSSAQAYAQVMLFVPKPRLAKGRRTDPPPPGNINLGGVPGDTINIPQSSAAPPPAGGGDEWFVYRENRPMRWDLLNQNWTVQLVPAEAESLVAILQTAPSSASDLRVPNLGGLSSADFRKINTH